MDYRAIGTTVKVNGTTCEIIDVERHAVTVVKPNGEGHTYGMDRWEHMTNRGEIVKA